VPNLTPMAFAEERYPFNNPAWLLQVKYDA
jgi:hypothetical protein